MLNMPAHVPARLQINSNPTVTERRHDKMSQVTTWTHAPCQAAKCKAQLTKRLEAVMLRRTKEEKLADQLPKKLDFICVCRLSDLQYRAYMCGAASWEAPRNLHTGCGAMMLRAFDLPQMR